MPAASSSQKSARPHAGLGQFALQELPRGRQHQADQSGRAGGPFGAAERGGLRRLSSESRPRSDRRKVNGAGNARNGAGVSAAIARMISAPG